MMSPPQFSNLEKRSILKVQVDQDFHFFLSLFQRTEWQFVWQSLKRGVSRCEYRFRGCDGLGRLGDLTDLVDSADLTDSLGYL